MKKNLILILNLIILLGCSTSKTNQEEVKTLSGLKKSDFKTKLNGKQTDLYVLNNSNGMEVCITNYGATIVSVMVPNKTGEMFDVVLGFDSISDYINIPNNFGATIGRYSNRIANGRVAIDGVEYLLPQNDGKHTLHGGDEGFNTKVFDVVHNDNQSITLSYISQDGEAGFPGTLKTKVKMSLTNDNAIDIEYEAKTDKKTVVNLTNHSYFNLTGNPERSILSHQLRIDADGYTTIDSTVMTTGEIASVEDTDMDFRTPTPVGERIDNYQFDQLRYGNGYDHNWVLNNEGNILESVATVYEPSTGIVLNVYTTEPGLQVYTGNFLDGTVIGKGGVAYQKRSAICLETQKYPDSPNKPDWPSAYLEPNETYNSRCIYQFSTSEIVELMSK